MSNSAPGVRLFINCDDITETWERFPGLDPSLPDGRVPDGMLVLGPGEALTLGAGYGELAVQLARSTTQAVSEFKAAWEGSVRGIEWSAVADVLAAGLGLGVAVPRLAVWRQPAAFAVSFVGGRTTGRRPTSQRGRDRGERPPFLRFEFLPGGGMAGLGLLNSSLWPEADGLVAASAGRDFVQTFQSYSGPGDDLTAYGWTGSALRNAGILVKSGTGVLPTIKVGVPVLTAGILAPVSSSWIAFAEALATAVNQARDEIEAGVQAAWAEDYPPPPGAPTHRVDYLDAGYAVLADLIYQAWRGAGGPLEPRGETGAHDRMVPRGLLGRRPKGPSVRAVLLEGPAAIWDWLTGSG